ncbi:MAG: peptidoglycan-binding domain-containing protein [Candidatus Paceibacterota bacterium]|jgi:peptidoglycan hydrolase-like protein with peptidoglycan-binding domain
MKTKNKFITLGLIGSTIFAIAFIVAPLSTNAATYSQISGSTVLKIGSKGESVRSLQQFIGSDSQIYPAGLVTGYFGSMTKNAVIQFQLSYNLEADGIVGSITRNKFNSVVAGGMGIDLSAPAINNLSVNVVGRNVTVIFNSNELVKSTVFYDINPINWSNWDDKIKSLAIPEISGMQNTDSSFSLNKQFTLNNLSANSVYNYTVVATDASGNISVVWPKTFTTGQ